MGSCSGENGLGGEGARSKRRPVIEYSRGSRSLRCQVSPSWSVRLSTATAEQGDDRTEGRPERERAPPIEHGPNVALDTAGDQEQDAGRSLGMDLVRHDQSNTRLLDPDVAGEDVPGRALGQVYLAAERGADPAHLDRDALAASEADPALRDRDVAGVRPADATLVDIDRLRVSCLHPALTDAQRVRRQETIRGRRSGWDDGDRRLVGFWSRR